MQDQQRSPPVWVMGLTNGVWGMLGGFSVVTVPEMLAAEGVSGGRIAAFVATLMWPMLLGALVSPMLDVRFSRRAYALALASIVFLSIMLTVLLGAHVEWIRWVLLLGWFAGSLYQGAVGGWMGSLIRQQDDTRLGIWMTVSNTGAGGLLMFSGSEILHHFSTATAALLLAAIITSPILLFFFIPAPGPDRKLAGESFRQFSADVSALLRQPKVLVSLALFILPAGSFSLTNVLGGLGKSFSAGERLVSEISGIGAILAGLAGSFALQPLAKFLPLRPLYLGIGITGAIFTLSLLLLPHSPAVYSLAITGENIFQALEFAAANAIAFETMGPGNPLAATLFTVLIAVSTLPIMYMGYADAAAYAWRGVFGAFLTDGSLGLTACVVLWVALRNRWTRGQELDAHQPPVIHSHHQPQAAPPQPTIEG